MRIYYYCVLHKYLYEDNEIIIRSQDIETIIRSSERQRVKIEEYTFLLKIYEVIANETNNDEIKK